MAADVERDSDGKIKRVTYRDHAGYTAEIEPPGETGRVRITTKGKDGGGLPVDLEPPEARRLAHDLIDMAGGDD